LCIPTDSNIVDQSCTHILWMAFTLSAVNLAVMADTCSFMNLHSYIAYVVCVLMETTHLK